MQNELEIFQNKMLYEWSASYIDLIQIVFENLECNELFLCSMVCKRFKDLIDSNQTISNRFLNKHVFWRLQKIPIFMQYIADNAWLQGSLVTHQEAKLKMMFMCSEKKNAVLHWRLCVYVPIESITKYHLLTEEQKRLITISCPVNPDNRYVQLEVQEVKLRELRRVGAQTYDFTWHQEAAYNNVDQDLNNFSRMYNHYSKFPLGRCMQKICDVYDIQLQAIKYTVQNLHLLPQEMHQVLEVDLAMVFNFANIPIATNLSTRERSVYIQNLKCRHCNYKHAKYWSFEVKDPSHRGLCDLCMKLLYIEVGKIGRNEFKLNSNEWDEIRMTCKIGKLVGFRFTTPSYSVRVADEFRRYFLKKTIANVLGYEDFNAEFIRRAKHKKSKRAYQRAVRLI